MKKKTVFISHLVGGDVHGNAKKILDICKKIHDKNIIPVVPYLVTIRYLNDEIAEDRKLGMEANFEAFRRGYIDEVWLFGDRISPGMEQEIRLALELSIPIFPKTDGTKKDFANFAK